MEVTTQMVTLTACHIGGRLVVVEEHSLPPSMSRSHIKVLAENLEINRQPRIRGQLSPRAHPVANIKAITRVSTLSSLSSSTRKLQVPWRDIPSFSPVFEFSVSR